MVLNQTQTIGIFNRNQPSGLIRSSHSLRISLLLLPLDFSILSAGTGSFSSRRVFLENSVDGLTARRFVFFSDLELTVNVATP